MSMKPKEALLKAGDITEIGRGRLSAEHIALLKTYAMPVSQGGKGWDIEGYSVTHTGQSAPVVEKTATPTGKTITEIPDETMPEQAYQAFVSVDGKSVEVGMRTVCNFCRRSLCYGLCTANGGTCVVWIDHKTEGKVQFKPRTRPRERWF